MIEFIRTFEGIIGTIIGVILGSVITIITKRSGKISCYTNSVLMDYKTVENGVLREIDNNEIPELGSINIEIDIYNGTDLEKVIRDIKLNFKAKNIEFNKVVNDLTSLQIVFSRHEYEALKFINIPSRKLVKINIGTSFEENELKKILNDKFKVTLTGSIPRLAFNRFNHFIAKLDRGVIAK